MIYQKITEKLEYALNELGGHYEGSQYLLEYANNHNVDWEMILPNTESSTVYGVVRVDSGQTLQAGDMPIRVEQLRLIVAIPEEREIFDKAVLCLRSLLTDFNNQLIEDDQEISDNVVDSDNDNQEVNYVSAQVFMNEYHDAQSQTVNGNRWWIAEVTFTINLFNSIVSSDDTSITIGSDKLKGIISATYINEKTVDGYVYNNVPTQKNSINGIRKQLTIQLIYLKGDPIFHREDPQNQNHYIGLLDLEDNISKTYTIVYNNGVISRTMTMYLASVSETIITADTVKATIAFAIAD